MAEDRRCELFVCLLQVSRNVERTTCFNKEKSRDDEEQERNGGEMEVEQRVESHEEFLEDSQVGTGVGGSG